MIVFPNAKINIGLQVLRKRLDGYHDLETVFYPVKIYDVLEVIEAKETSISTSGIPVNGNVEDNLCLKAYHLLAADHQLPPIEIHIHKNIPIGAGLGGGSSDAAFMIKLLNEKFSLRITTEEMEAYAHQLGADCAFFIQNKPVFAEGIGTDFSAIDLDLSAYHFLFVKPHIHISTQEAYRSVKLSPKGEGLKSAIQRPVSEWHIEKKSLSTIEKKSLSAIEKACTKESLDIISNDFETAIFKKYPEIKKIKTLLYQHGAIYASMSGSGSTVFGLFKDKPSFPENNAEYIIF